MNFQALIVISLSVAMLTMAEEKDSKSALSVDGEWVGQEIWVAKEKMSDRSATSMKIQFHGKNYTIIKPGSETSGTFTIDNSKDPHQLTLNGTVAGGDPAATGDATIISAVYELNGDTLKICHPVEEGGERPTTVRADKSVVMATFKKKVQKGSLR